MYYYIASREELKNLLSKIPIDLAKIRKEDLNKEILRAAIIAEFDAINLYEQMAVLTDDKHLKTILLDIAKEEKTHVGEFQALLLMNDDQQENELAEGKKEVEELTS
jgi:rubrerythrin